MFFFLHERQDQNKGFRGDFWYLKAESRQKEEKLKEKEEYRRRGGRRKKAADSTAGWTISLTMRVQMALVRQQMGKGSAPEP